MQNHSWIDRTEYPFESHYIEISGRQMHYVDEGSGRPILMVHGTPTWSFMYRKLIKGLSDSYRVIAPDNLGFGLSEQPYEGVPQTHAENLTEFIEKLDLKDITLVVHDFGGPIGLSYAINNPDNVRNMVLFNTWMWSREDEPAIQALSFILGGSVGKFLYTQLNFSARFLLRSMWGEKRPLTPEIHRHYINAFPTPESRLAAWVMARELMGSRKWFAELWEQRHKIAGEKVFLAWGLKDAGFPRDFLTTFEELFIGEVVSVLPYAGHVVPDEQGEEILPQLRDFLEKH